MSDEVIAVITAIFLFLTAINLTAGFLLIRGARRADFGILALNERALVAFLIGGGVTLDVFLGFNRLFDWGMPNTLVVLILMVSIILTTVPSAIWLYLFYSGRFTRAAEEPQDSAVVHPDGGHKP